MTETTNPVQAFMERAEMLYEDMHFEYVKRF